jgi:hypothetical protein
MKKPDAMLLNVKQPKPRYVGKAGKWALAKAKEKQTLRRQNLALGGQEERLEALYGIRKT